MPIEVLVQRLDAINAPSRQLLIRAVQQIASDYDWADGQISIAIVDDATIHQVNREYLKHDYATDVISFDLTEDDSFLEGEIIASWDTAQRVAKENHWSSAQELLLYVVHGMLHIVGLDDKTRREANRMRAEEQHYLIQLTGDASPCVPISERSEPPPEPKLPARPARRASPKKAMPVKPAAPAKPAVPAKPAAVAKKKSPKRKKG